VKGKAEFRSQAKQQNSELRIQKKRKSVKAALRVFFWLLTPGF
jgi:hypothetical protein